MSYTIERLPDAPILIGHWSPEFDYARDITPFMRDLAVRLDEEPAPVGLVLNMGTPILSIGDVFDCVKLTQPGSDSVYFHSQVALACWVTTEPQLLQVAGQAPIAIHSDLDAALEQIRGRV